MPHATASHAWLTLWIDTIPGHLPPSVPYTANIDLDDEEDDLFPWSSLVFRQVTGIQHHPLELPAPLVRGTVAPQPLTTPLNVYGNTEEAIRVCSAFVIEYANLKKEALRGQLLVKKKKDAELWHKHVAKYLSSRKVNNVIGGIFAKHHLALRDLTSMYDKVSTM
jgi:hypothetical protein